jgi:hypothetical protein
MKACVSARFGERLVAVRLNAELARFDLGDVGVLKTDLLGELALRQVGFLT